MSFGTSDIGHGIFYVGSFKLGKTVEQLFEINMCLISSVSIVVNERNEWELVNYDV